MTVKTDSTFLRNLQVQIATDLEAEALELFGPVDIKRLKEASIMKTTPATTHVLPGFKAGKTVIPDLTVSDDRLDLTVTAKVRSPYNKALFRRNRPILNKDVNLRTIVALHEELSGHKSHVSPSLPRPSRQSSKAQARREPTEAQRRAWREGGERLKAYHAARKTQTEQVVALPNPTLAALTALAASLTPEQKKELAHALGQ